MTASLAPLIGLEFSEPAHLEKFFSPDKARDIQSKWLPREQPKVQIPAESCKTNLFFGFFFDGTNNSYAEAEPQGCMSNVARLYDCFPGRSVPGVLPASAEWKHEPSRYTHFFKVYAPGVSTKFEQVGDRGEGVHKTAGAAGGALAERRIIWALVQAINNVHRYFLGAPLVQAEEMKRLLSAIVLNKNTRAVLANGKNGSVPDVVYEANRLTAQEFERLLLRLHAALKYHLPDEKTGRPAKVDPGIVKTIYVSVFGYSRGATQARAFTNWLHSLCKLDARLRGKPGGLSLGGFKVEFYFLGIFDTVASVGLASSVPRFHGHGSWADSEDSLRILSGIKCLHLVAGHELRRSFPLDSIAVGGTLPDGCSEIVVPGVHSDVGGGYRPGEQGRGVDPDGSDMLSRIPLLLMYKAARLSGVPLKLEFATPQAKARFALKADTIKAFNAYIATCKQTSGPLHSIMREQARKQIEWRLVRRIHSANPIQESSSFLRASTYDQNDLHSAAIEFEDEIKEFEKWLADKGRGFRPVAQPAGLENDGGEREEIATWWRNRGSPESEVLHFFDEFVHDSRAWFKPFGPDDDAAMLARLKSWVQSLKISRDQESLPWYQRQSPLAGKVDYGLAPTKILTPEEKRAAAEYEKTGKIPRMYLPGREPGSGYLRYRKVYGGSDSVLLSSAEDFNADKGKVA